MSNLNTASEINELYLLRKINDFQSNTGEILTEEDRQQIIQWLLRGTRIDLSGVTAIRGFLYQYYVAVYYMVDMLCANTWTEVIFELLDDIALIGGDKIRFVQVKTVKEGGVDNHLIPSKLRNRDDGGLSWLDKLFLLNTRYIEEEGKVLKVDGRLIDTFEVQFEITTNAQYDKNVLASYAKNDEFKGTPRHNSDDLSEWMNRDFTVDIDHRGVKFKLDNSLYALHGAEWYLDRFYLNHLGSFSELERQIIHKISSVLDRKHGLLQPYIAAMVFQKLLSVVIGLTHRDGMVDTTNFIFTKETIREWVSQFEQESHILFYEQAKENVLKFKFDSLFQDAIEEIRSGQGNAVLKDELIRTLQKIEDDLVTQLENGDVYVYETFLNRLFELRFSHAPFSLERPRNQTFVLESLTYMALSLSCYSKINLIFNEAKLIFKQAHEEPTIHDTFAMYNARNQERYEVAARKVITAVEECGHSQSMGDDYYCFITHAKKAEQEQKDYWSILVPITSNGGIKEESVTKKHLNVKFRPSSILDDFSDQWQEENESSSFTEPRMIEQWQNLLKNV